MKERQISLRDVVAEWVLLGPREAALPWVAWAVETSQTVPMSCPGVWDSEAVGLSSFISVGARWSSHS